LRSTTGKLCAFAGILSPWFVMVLIAYNDAFILWTLHTSFAARRPFLLWVARVLAMWQTEFLMPVMMLPV
jgi:hypothetical protein